MNEIIKEYCKKLNSDIELSKRILFVQTPQVILDSFNKDIALANGYYIFPPTGIQYLCSTVQHRNLDMQILDLNFEILKTKHICNSEI